MPKSFTEIRCFLLDMDGTFFLGNRLLEGSVHFLEVLADQGKEYLFLTNNSSQHRRMYAEKISRLGVSIPESRILTSGEATALFLKQNYPGALLAVTGTPALEEELSAAGFLFSADRPDVVVLGFDTTLTYPKLARLCTFVRAGLPYIATHPDVNCPTEDGFIPDIGAMIACVKASTGREPDRVIGKPNRWIVEAACQKLGLPMQSLAMVGDRLYTDIALGKTCGIPTVLVLSGETRPEDLAGSPYQPDAVFANLGQAADWLASHRS